MSQRKNLNHVIGIAMLAMMFGASSIHAQTGAGSSGMSSGSQSGQMGSSDRSGTSGASGSSGGSTGSSTSGGAYGGSSGGSMSGGGMSGDTTGSSTSGSQSQSSSGQQVSRSDQDMMRDMAYANLSEIEAGKLAQSKSNNDEVKNFAQRMVEDHTKAQQELQQLADAKGVKLPTEPDMKHKTAMTAMKALSGDKFDQAYVRQGGLNDHRSTHELLARVESRASDPQLKSLASKMLPTINQHMTIAEGVKSRAQASGSSGSKGKSSSGSDDK